MQAVNYEGADLQIVEAFDRRDRSEKLPAYWSQDEVAHLRKTIKDHYIAEQRRLCCFCHHEIMTDNNSVWDGEHIIPRATHPQFMFEPRNLAISCKDCNGAKKDQNVLRNASRVTFPAESDDYIIVHPHFDNYDEHIIWFGHVPASNKSKKGKRTIEMCGLLRYTTDFVDLNADITDHRFRKTVGELMTFRSKVEAKAVMAALSVYIDALPDDKK